jgi:hypothetical protein
MKATHYHISLNRFRHFIMGRLEGEFILSKLTIYFTGIYESIMRRIASPNMYIIQTVILIYKIFKVLHSSII